MGFLNYRSSAVQLQIPFARISIIRCTVIEMLISSALLAACYTSYSFADTLQFDVRKNQDDFEIFYMI